MTIWRQMFLFSLLSAITQQALADIDALRYDLVACTDGASTGNDA